MDYSGAANDWLPQRVRIKAVVHAYCHHTFDGNGPVWYSEGMAEMTMTGPREIRPRADPREIKYLRENPSKTLAEAISPYQTSVDSWENYASRRALSLHPVRVRRQSGPLSAVDR